MILPSASAATSDLLVNRVLLVVFACLLAFAPGVYDSLSPPTNNQKTYISKNIVINVSLPTPL